LEVKEGQWVILVGLVQDLVLIGEGHVSSIGWAFSLTQDLVQYYSSGFCPVPSNGFCPCSCLGSCPVPHYYLGNISANVSPQVSLYFLNNNEENEGSRESYLLIFKCKYAIIPPLKFKRAFLCKSRMLKCMNHIRTGWRQWRKR